MCWARGKFWFALLFYLYILIAFWPIYGTFMVNRGQSYFYVVPIYICLELKQTKLEKSNEQYMDFSS